MINIYLVKLFKYFKNPFLSICIFIYVQGVLKNLTDERRLKSCLLSL